MAENGGASFYATKEEITNATRKGSAYVTPETKESALSQAALPWTQVEELLVVRNAETAPPVTWRRSLRDLALMLLLGSTMVGLMRSSKQALVPLQDGGSKMEK